MSAPKNIQRDGLWIEPNTANDTAFATESLMNLTTCLVSGPSAVADDKANVHSDNTAYSISVDAQRCIGVFMQQPAGDNTPYRIKASAYVLGQADYSEWKSIVIGYAPASITGTDDLIEDPYYIPFRGSIDELVIVPTLNAGDPFIDRALCIGLAIQAYPAITTLRIRAQLSVQRLATKPPTMHNAVS